eukprot:402493-Pelagomonas_calceolata.AAC.1
MPARKPQNRQPGEAGQKMSTQRRPGLLICLHSLPACRWQPFGERDLQGFPHFYCSCKKRKDNKITAPVSMQREARAQEGKTRTEM